MVGMMNEEITLEKDWTGLATMVVVEYHIIITSE